MQSVSHKTIACMSTCAADSAKLKGSDAKHNTSDLREVRFRQIFQELARGISWQEDLMVSQEDLKVGLERAMPDCSVSIEQVEHMMRIADLDNSGQVDYAEFRVLFEGFDEEEMSLRTFAEFWLQNSDTIRVPELIFQSAWQRLCSRAGGEEHVRLPAEIMFLGGAPGAGKGTMTPYIMYERGLTAEVIVMSNLLTSPAAKKIIDDGGLVSDMEVFGMLLDELASPAQLLGALVDGFPRTVTQVQLLKMLDAKMRSLNRNWDGTDLGLSFPKPRFRMCILYVDEKLSVERQLWRGRQAVEHNKKARETGEGELVEVRETDLSVKAARNRYRLFAESTMAANEALNETFPFNMINAAGTVQEVRQVVMLELSYQSSLELQEETYNAIKVIPPAAELAKRARQRLVERLDSYQKEQAATFAAVISVIKDEFVPIIRRHALVGEARIRTKHAEVFGLPGALDMAVDVMYDRGFCLCAEDRGGGSFRFVVTFETPHVRVAAGAVDQGPVGRR